MKKKKQIATVYSQTEIGEEIFDLWVTTDLAKEAISGQFLSIYPQNQAKLLPRPISICEIDREQERIRFVYRVVGEGTKEFATYHAGNAIFILGNIGNGYPLREAKNKHAVLLGGGMGIPPMLQLAKELKEQDEKTKISIVVGYRDQDTFLVDDLKRYGDVYIASDDGSVGTKGNVLTAVTKQKLQADIIYACGPKPMLGAIQSYAKEQGIKAYISLEERMACGVGACLGCVCQTTKEDAHSHVNNARVCVDGPVFEAQEVVI